MSAARIEDALTDAPALVIRVPLADLAHDAQLAFDGAYGFGRHALAVVDPAAFARALLGELNRRERGLTPVERMIDRACVDVVESAAATLDGAGVMEGKLEAAE